MPVIQIESVEAFCPPGAQGVDIHTPEPGQGLDLYALHVTGALRGLAAPAPALELRVNGRCLPRWPLAPGPGAPAINLIIAALDLPARFCLEVSLLQPQGAVRIARLQGRRGPLLPAPRYQPLLLASLGRSGSTLLMQYLSAHPEIVCHRTYPLETKIGQFAARAAAVQTRPADPQAQEGSGLRNNPYFRPDPDSFALLAGPLAATALRSAVAQTEQFYDGIAALQGRPAGTAKLFAEKIGLDGEIPGLLEALFGRCRRLLLVRDFRDVLASVLAFNAKRGYAAFGREGVASDLDYVARMGQYARSAAAYAAGLPPGCVLRYEDLIRDPAGTLAGLFQALELRHDAAALAAALAGAATPSAALRFHRTSRTEQDSIGRWRQDLAPDLQPALAAALGPALAAFGYDPAEDGAA